MAIKYRDRRAANSTAPNTTNLYERSAMSSRNGSQSVTVGQQLALIDHLNLPGTVPVRVMRARKRKALPKFCRNGHEWTPENTAILPDGRRSCRACTNARHAAKHKQKLRASKERKVPVKCPVCKKDRLIAINVSEKKGYERHACLSCSRKRVRYKSDFGVRNCRHCGQAFQRRSGAAVLCDSCGKREPISPRACKVCGTLFVGYKSKKACSVACGRRLRVNDSYFGGRMFYADGWKTKTCRCCGRYVPRHFHIHHVYGYPKHERLSLLCRGCHDKISKCASTPNVTPAILARLLWYATAQLLGRDPTNDILNSTAAICKKSHEFLFDPRVEVEVVSLEKVEGLLFEATVKPKKTKRKSA